MKIWISFLLMCLAFSGSAQMPDTLTLSWLQQKATENYPLMRQKDVLAKASQIRTRQVNDNWLPKAEVNAQATYQSAVTEIGISNPFFQAPVIDKDMEKLNLEVSQVIYDGNQGRSQKTLEEAGLQVDQQNVEIQLYQLRDKISQLFFAVLFFDENHKVLDKFLEDLRLRLTNTDAGVANGALLESQADELRAEIIKMEQNILELVADKQSTLDILSQWTGQNLNPKQYFALPKAEISGIAGSKNIRPELRGFELQLSRLEANKDLVSTRNIPDSRLSARPDMGNPVIICSIRVLIRIIWLGKVKLEFMGLGTGG